MYKLILLSSLCICILIAQTSADPLSDGFLNPPDSARPWVYWFFIDGNLSREGITADLESMATAGIGGVVIMEVDVGIPRGPVEFMSDEWRALFRHAVEEAERLGLEITLNAGPGWTGSGGPWVKAEQSMQHLVASATEAAGPARFEAVLPQPEPLPPYFGEAGLPDWLLKARQEFYADVAVLAFPRVDDTRLADVDEKALYVREPYTSKAGVKPYLPAPAEYEKAPASAVIATKDVVDVSGFVQPDGRLVWDVPAGDWTILRFGRVNTGANTRPAPLPGLGFESDKFDRAALDAHFDAFVGRLLDAIGPRDNNRTAGWTMLHIDSWEMGSQNWTLGFEKEFERRRGYSPLRYLPVMTGRIVESAEVSERFLWDLRLTGQELVIENHGGYLKELGRRHGFGLSIEPYDMNPTADTTLGGVADVPMCEFWSQGHGFDSAFTCFEAASIAHTLGRPVVAAEAFTAGSSEAWQLYPAAMKNQGDWAFCTGINRIVFHRFAHQPWLDRRPGMTMGPYGVHWDRTQTWWPMVSAYHRYLARCQFMLRQGTPVADICYLVPEGAPHVFRPPASALEGELPERRGYTFDGCAPETLLNEARVEDGLLAFPSGAAYRLLVLPACETMRPALLRKIKELVEAGATVIGSPPRKSPSLTNYPECDDEVQSLAVELWGEMQPPSKPVERTFGAGRIVWGGELEVRRQDSPMSSTIEQARWIWDPEVDFAAAMPDRRFFRRAVQVEPNRRIRSAQVWATADNEFALYVNGKAALKGSDFRTLYTKEIRALLKDGENVLAVDATNGGDGPNPAGFVAALFGEYEDGGTFAIVTDAQWQVSRVPGDGPATSMDPSEDWKLAQELGPIGMAPWHLDASQGRAEELYPEYEATALVLSNLKVQPDFESDGPIRYTHRRTESADVYFVANRTAEKLGAACTFRVSGREPERWDPVNGTRRALPLYNEENGCTKVTLEFLPHQSWFVVFPDASARDRELKKARYNFDIQKLLGFVNGAWDVSFEPANGGPGEVRFERLCDWRERPEPGIRHYSGVATYRKVFDLPKSAKDNASRIFLDLGEVHCMARVRVNGRDAGVAWCAPWRVEITDAVKAKENRLEIDVANLWPNRLIGDSGLPENERVTWTTWNPYKPDSPLLPSGLLGPVEILTAK